MKKTLLLTIIVLLSSSCGPTPEEINDEWFNYYNNTNAAIMNKLSEIMKRKGEYPSKEFCTNEYQLNQESRTGYKADGSPGTNFTPQYWSRIRFEPFGNGTLHKGVKQTPWHSIEYSYEFKIKWYFQLSPSNLENDYVLYKLDDGGKVEKQSISLILDNFTNDERDEFWVCVDSIRNEFMYKNNYIINKHDNFEKDENLWIFKNPNNSYSHGAFHGISVNWDDRGEFLFPMKEIDRYHSIITSSKRSDSEKIHLWRLFVDNLTYATLIDSTNPLIWFTLGEIFDDINYIASTNNFSKLGETLPRGYRLKDTRRVVHPYEKVLELDSFFNPKNLNSKKFKYFNLVDSYSKIISQWCATAHFFNILGKSDSAKYAYNKAFEKVGTDHPFIEYGRNILRSCDQNSILFTNGDNDTYPLWYLQEIENFRKDVTVINLSLLQTKWYIRKVVNSNPEFSRLLKLTDKEIDQLPTSIGWEKQNIKISAKNETGWIEWECKPTHNDNALLLKDIMVLRIIDKMAWEFPIYFALTVSSKSWLGLNDYLPMEGMVFHLLDVKSQQINPTKTQENLAKYTYESIDNPLTEIYLGPLMRNYHSIYVQLVVNYYMDYIKLDKKISKQKVVEQKRQKVEEILNEMFIKLPNEKIPYDPNLYYQCAMLYYNIGNNEKAKGILKEIIDTDPDNQNANDILVKINQGD